MNASDLDRLRSSLVASRRPANDLAARITASLGAPPRLLPSRTSLAIERAAVPSLIAAAVVFASAVAIQLAHPGTRADQARESLVSSALEGTSLPASDVFAAMTGMAEPPGEDQ